MRMLPFAIEEKSVQLRSICRGLFCAIEWGSIQVLIASKSIRPMLLLSVTCFIVILSPMCPAQQDAVSINENRRNAQLAVEGLRAHVDELAATKLIESERLLNEVEQHLLEGRILEANDACRLARDGVEEARTAIVWLGQARQEHIARCSLIKVRVSTVRRRRDAIGANAAAPLRVWANIISALDPAVAIDAEVLATHTAGRPFYGVSSPLINSDIVRDDLAAGAPVQLLVEHPKRLPVTLKAKGEYWVVIGPWILNGHQILHRLYGGPSNVEIAISSQ